MKNPELLAEAIHQRETIISTGISLQLAIPHVRLASITDLAVCVGLSRNNIEDYDSIDGLPVRLVVMIVARDKGHSVSRKLADWHVRSGWLDRIGSGAFVRGGDTPDWTGGVYALQSQLGLTVHVGGRSALELQGRAHFVPLGRKQILLVSDKQERLPKWFTENDWGADVTHRCASLFERPLPDSLTTMPCGKYEVSLSTRERAIMECMHLARTNSDIEHAHELMAGLGLLRPNVVQSLLERCASAKVKRLFLWSAEAAQHQWFDRLNASKIELGRGKRQLYKGGRLDTKYDITVPPTEELPDI